MKELIIIAVITTVILYVFRQKPIPYNPFRQYVYHFRSHADGGSEREERYLRQTNGVILEGEGVVPWFTDGQLFDKNKFNLCPIGGKFIFSYHTSGSYGTMITVNHYYKTELEGDNVRILWTGQSEEWFPMRTYKLFEVPKDWVYVPEPSSGVTDNVFHIPNKFLEPNNLKSPLIYIDPERTLNVVPVSQEISAP